MFPSASARWGHLCDYIFKGKYHGLSIVVVGGGGGGVCVCVSVCVCVLVFQPPQLERKNARKYLQFSRRKCIDVTSSLQAAKRAVILQ